MTTPREEMEEIILEIHRTSSRTQGPVEVTPLIRLLRLCERVIAELEIHQDIASTATELAAALNDGEDREWISRCRDSLEIEIAKLDRPAGA